MRAFAVDPADADESVVGSVLCHDIVSVGELGRVKLGKGRILEPDDIPALHTYSGEIHLIQMESGDVHEDTASIRLAELVAGEGVALRPPVESQSQLRAKHRGLLQVRADILHEINAIPDVSVFTGFDGQPVEADKTVGATKVTPLVVEDAILSRAEQIIRENGPVVQVHPFLGKKVGVVVRERLAGKAKKKFEAALYRKVGWFGSPVARIQYVPDEVSVIADAVEGFLVEDVGLVLAAGVNSTNPLDMTIQALERIGAQTEKRGVPAHPGSTCWLAYVGDTPIFGLALCGMFSKTTALDLLLPRFLSGRPVRAADVAGLGHGGLLSKDMAFRFPTYALES